MNKIFILSAGLFMMITSCRRDLSELNKNPKGPLEAPSYAFFTSGQRQLVNTITSTNVNLNNFRLTSQYWTQTTYIDESRYNFSRRNVYDNLWNALYVNVLSNLNEAKRLIPKDVADPDIKKNQLAIVDFMQVYTFYYLVTTYGNIPYSEALDFSKSFPKYDDAKTILNDLLTRIDADIAAMNPAKPGFGGADNIYGGDVSKWRAFANSFKLKMGMTIADSDPAKAKATVESAIQSGVFNSNAQNARFMYLASTPNTNPVWVDLVQSGRKDFVVGKTIADTMNNLNDPRMKYYFTKDPNGNYSGGIIGSGNGFSNFSKPHSNIALPDYPAVLMDYAEVEFLLAEAVERGLTVGGTAEEHYNKAITASINFWGGDNNESLLYLAQPSVQYTTAAGNWQKKIGMQKWIALYNRGWDGWIEFRRLDYPQLQPATGAISVFPKRYRYPVNEQNVNKANYDQAAAAIGGDAVATKLFWDKF
jgi:Starch-binding associating with outer membrane